MDLITHGVLGAAVAVGLARKHELKVAATVGCVAAMLPDADTLIQSAEDSLLRLEYHRQFTHSLIFMPLGGLIGAVVLWLLFRQQAPFSRIYLFALAAYVSAPLLDSCTSYGTQLLWPFSDERIAWRIVAIIDPLVTVALIAALAFALAKGSRRPVAAGLLLIVGYFSLGLMQRGMVEQQAYALAAQRGHEVSRLEVKPTMGNLLLWRSVYQSGEFYYVDAIRISMFSEVKVYSGGAIKAFDPAAEAALAGGGDSVLFRDIQRFSSYSNGFVVRHPEQPSVIGDIRYAMLPNSLLPLWGIETDVAPGQHAQYKDIRNVNAKKVDAFLEMLAGSYAVDVALEAGVRVHSDL